MFGPLVTYADDVKAPDKAEFPVCQIVLVELLVGPGGLEVGLQHGVVPPQQRVLVPVPEGGGVLYCTALYCTVLYCTALYCTVLY